MNNFVICSKSDDEVAATGKGSTKLVLKVCPSPRAVNMLGSPVLTSRPRPAAQVKPITPTCSPHSKKVSIQKS